MTQKVSGKSGSTSPIANKTAQPPMGGKTGAPAMPSSKAPSAPAHKAPSAPANKAAPSKPRSK